jgi:hypothetical protein
MPAETGTRHKKQKRKAETLSFFKNGAGNESRTRDLNLGKVALYQLSYSRNLAHGTKTVGARDRNRTGTAARPRDFKSLVSTSFTTRAK